MAKTRISEPIHALEGIISVGRASKTSWQLGDLINYSESYQIELENPERNLKLADETLDPMAEIPSARLISVSFDTSEEGPALLEQNSRYRLVLEKIVEGE